jgi:hypothetical protein
MSLPAPLAQFAEQYNALAQQYNDGHITQEQATAALAALAATDGTGAVWGLSPNGYFTRAPYPGAPAEPADPAQWVDPAAQPAGPAFPSPLDASTDLDTPPQGAWPGDPAWPGAPTGPHPATAPPVHPGAPTVPSGLELGARSLKDTGTPRGGGVLGKVGAVVKANKLFTGIVVAGALAIGAAVILPGMTGEPGTPLPTEPTPPTTMPTDPGDPAAPAASTTTPTTTDAETVITALASTDPALVQSVIHAPLGDVDLLRVQALWAGLVASDVTIAADAAAAAEDGSIVQVWHLTRPGADAQTTALTATWVAVDATGAPVAPGTQGATWKLASAPTF